MLPQQLIPLSWGLGLLAFLRHRASGDGTVEPVWFSPALGQELAAVPCGSPIRLQRALAGSDHGREGWLRAGTWLQFQLSPGLSWPSFDSPSCSSPLPCLSCGPIGHVKNWRVEMAGGQALRFGLETIAMWPSQAKSAPLWLAPERAWATT